MCSRECSYRERLDLIQARIVEAALGAGRDPKSVKLVAVSKNVPPEEIAKAYASGQRAFGENYVQEALRKLPNLQPQCPDAEYHFLGRLQRNKVSSVVGRFVVLHSVDRVELAEEIERVACRLGVRQTVLVQVNLSEEASKGGISRLALSALFARMRELSALDVKGLMLIGSSESSRAQAEFQELRILRDRLQIDTGMVLPELSMGMSHDFGAAIAEGATIVRVGTAIFGERPAAD